MSGIFDELSVLTDIHEDRGLCTAALRVGLAVLCSRGRVSNREKTIDGGRGGRDRGYCGWFGDGKGDGVFTATGDKDGETRRYGGDLGEGWGDGGYGGTGWGDGPDGTGRGEGPCP